MKYIWYTWVTGTYPLWLGALASAKSSQAAAASCSCRSNWQTYTINSIFAKTYRNSFCPFNLVRFIAVCLAAKLCLSFARFNGQAFAFNDLSLIALTNFWIMVEIAKSRTACHRERLSNDFSLMIFFIRFKPGAPVWEARTQPLR